VGLKNIDILKQRLVPIVVLQNS